MYFACDSLLIYTAFLEHCEGVRHALVKRMPRWKRRVKAESANIGALGGGLPVSGADFNK